MKQHNQVYVRPRNRGQISAQVTCSYIMYIHVICSIDMINACGQCMGNHARSANETMKQVLILCRRLNLFTLRYGTNNL